MRFRVNIGKPNSNQSRVKLTFQFNFSSNMNVILIKTLKRHTEIPLLICLIVSLLPCTHTQIWQQSQGTVNKEKNFLWKEHLKRFTDGAELFSLDFFSHISNETPKRNFMVSPFAIWSLLLLLTEGAEGQTLKELQDTLRIANDQGYLRSTYKQIKNYLTVNTTTIQSASFHALLTDINKPVNRDYEKIVTFYYDSALIPIDFLDINNTVTQINNDIEKATQGLLPYTVQPQDFKDANLLMLSSLFFKGAWRYPFIEKQTHKAPFHDENGVILTNVDMMTQTGPFIYVGIKELESHVLELPYGILNRLSMLIILPKKGVKVNTVANNLRNFRIAEIFQRLNATAPDFENEPVEVFMPKFSTETHFSLRTILTNMGIADVFEPQFADLNKIAKDLYVSSIFHSTRIICNEEGTEAVAITKATLSNKSTPPRFYVNRPFIYLIVEKTANILLFAGEIKTF